MDDAPSDEDADIARGLRAGEARAWDRRYVAHVDRVWCAAAKYLGGHEASVSRTFPGWPRHP